MLQNIVSISSAGSPVTAVDLLIGCHARIRHFTSVISRLAHAEGSSPEEITAAADAAHRYFAVALPLHEADEEESLRPRLLQLQQPELSVATAAMEHQHQAIDALVERTLPLLLLLSRNPAKLPEVHGELCSLSKALEEAFRGHLQLEETAIFPAIRNLLTVEVQAAILDEMQRRRKQG